MSPVRVLFLPFMMFPPPITLHGFVQASTNDISDVLTFSMHFKPAKAKTSSCRGGQAAQKRDRTILPRFRGTVSRNIPGNKNTGKQKRLKWLQGNYAAHIRRFVYTKRYRQTQSAGKHACRDEEDQVSGHQPKLVSMAFLKLLSLVVRNDGTC